MLRFFLVNLVLQNRWLSSRWFGSKAPFEWIFRFFAILSLCWFFCFTISFHWSIEILTYFFL